MIERLEKFASQFYWLKPILLILAGLSLATSLLVMLQSTSVSEDVLLIPALLVFCWCCITYSVLNLFVLVPARADKNSGLWNRCKIAAIRGCYLLLATLTIILTLTLVLVSYQLIRTWLRSY